MPNAIAAVPSATQVSAAARAVVAAHAIDEKASANVARREEVCLRRNHHAQSRRLAGAVRTNQGVNLATIDSEIEGIGRGPVKALADAAKRERDRIVLQIHWDRHRSRSLRLFTAESFQRRKSSNCSEYVKLSVSLKAHQASGTILKITSP